MPKSLRNRTKAVLALGAAMAAAPTMVVAQQVAPPAFVDERRLPPTEAEARRKAEEERRRAAEAEAKQKAEAEARQKQEEQRRQAAEAEARQKAEAEARQKQEEQRRQAAEAEARQKVEAEARQKQEEQRRQAAEADAKQKAESEARQKQEEQRRQAAEAEARQKAEAEARQKQEEQRRQAAEAEARQKAEAEARQKQEEQRRQAAEAEARRKAEETRRQAAAAAPAAAPAGAAAGARAAGDCAADRIAARAIGGGRVQIDIETPCRPSQQVVVRYGPFEFQRQLDGAGRMSMILDLFQGKSAPVSLQIGDGPRQAVSLEAVDLSGISKVAVVWKAPVNLDLHAYEYAARHGSPGHVWSGSPSSAEAAESETRRSKRGHGFISSSDDGKGDGDKVEVYTFWHHGDQQSGLVATALDYESRGGQPAGPTCGTGAHASVVYDTFLLTARGQLSRERGELLAATCGAQLSGTGRFLEDAIPDLDAKP